MGEKSISRRAVLARVAASAALASVPTLSIHPARAAANFRLVSQRNPTLEFYAGKIRTALPDVTVTTELMPADKANELATITLSSKSDAIDLVYASDSTVLSYAKNGWLRPLDDLWSKYAAEYQLDDFVKRIMEMAMYKGNLYFVPFNSATHLLYYRKDILAKVGKQPPTTFDEYLALAKQLHSPSQSGTITCLKPIDSGLNEIHWYMNAIGDGWFDADLKPIFNNAGGVKAIEMLKQITSYSQRGFTTAGNDEGAIALQQGLTAMGIAWSGRANSMNDPKQSRVIGQIGFVVPPQGHMRLNSEGYGISAFSKQDPEVAFRILMTAASKPNMQQAAATSLPPRLSVVGDPAVQATYAHYPASLEGIKIGLPVPRLPEFYAVGEFITRRVIQAVTGEMPIKAALDTAALETQTYLKGHGYYQ